MKKLKFAKFVASGNDFVILNNIDKKINPKRYPIIAQKLCRRKFSVGADGLLIIEPSSNPYYAFKMVYYNSDGSKASMCGNGARCISYYAYELELCEDEVSFETDAGVVKCQIKRTNTVKLKLPEPKDTKLDFVINVNNKEITANFVNTGVPHTVIFVEDIEKVDVNLLGKEIRYHKLFMPEGTNVNFVKVLDKHNLIVRTYERGVENETLSCGTGVTASAVISAIKGFVVSPVSCLTQSNEKLIIKFKKNYPEDIISPVSDLFLEGKVYHVFDGEIEI